MKKVKDKYFVWHMVKGWVEVNGEPVVIPGLEEFDLFIHCGIDGMGFSDTESFTVSEGKSGCRIGKMAPVKEEAIEHATRMLTNHGKDEVDKVIGEAIDRNGLSPRWSFED